MRKCINPLWYFHPLAVKYRGLCEADAAAAAADVVKAARLLPCFPDTGSKDFAARCRKTAPWSFGSLPRKRSFLRPGERRSDEKTFARSGFCRRNNRTLEIIFREFCPKSSNLFSAGTARSHRKKYDFSVKWVLGQIPNKPHRWENVPTDALLASL